MIRFLANELARPDSPLLLAYYNPIPSQRHNKSLSSCYQSYKKNHNIIDTIEGFGLDVDQFWYAILFIYWLTEIRCVNVFRPEGNSAEQMRKLSDYLQGVKDFTIVVEGKKKLVINDTGVIASIQKFMDDRIVLYEERGLDDFTSYNSKSNHNESASIQMWFATMRYLKLFENLELPTIRARDSEVKYYKRMVAGERIDKGGGNKTVSYNKMLLISRIMYFTRMTRNENYLGSDEILKGIVKQYKNLKINTHNPKYSF